MKCRRCDALPCICALVEVLEEAIAPLNLSEEKMLELVQRFRNELVAPWKNVEFSEN